MPAVDPLLLIIIALGVALLIFLVVHWKVNAFLALLIVSMGVGVASGMPLMAVIDSVKEGMGSTLGFVAVIVGLGAILGAVLEDSGGAKQVAFAVLDRFGDSKAQQALVFVGFIVAIPVFFDVGIILLYPVVEALHKKSGRPLMYYGLPLIAGLMVTHSFIPPTPGPVAAADILKADLGWVIAFGFVTGLPTAILSGIWVARKLVPKTIAPVEERIDSGLGTVDRKLYQQVMLLIFLPLVLILAGSISGMVEEESRWLEVIQFLGHPFTALTLTTVLALYILGVKRGRTKEELMLVSQKSLAPAGAIILITGGGGAFKQILIDTGGGAMIAEALGGTGLYLPILAYLVALLVRVTQGSATVAMITAAGIMAPLTTVLDVDIQHNALIVICVAAGSVFLSHVNDSGFWLINRYYNQSVRETMRYWSITSSCMSVFGFLIAWALYVLV